MGDPAQYAPGQQLAGTVYRVVRHLATGGMGSVYDVEDVTVGKRYVMERLNGQNLRVVIEKKGSLELSHCYRIAIDVLDALEHAHENSVIHRDVKPDNIFLHRNANGTTTTKLLDFGIMRLLDRKASHTQGKFIGTLRYASPEQIFGGELGPATDIYSLGLVLYEMLAGRGPFDDVGDAYAIGAAHAQRPPPPLSQFVAVPAPLERLVMSSLAKAPEERPRDCFSFASDLRRMLRDDEAAPKSATAINVLTSAAPNTVAAQGLAGTESSAPSGHARTDVGMIPPSAVAPSGPYPGGALPPTVRHGAGASGVAAAAGVGPTAMGVAPTMLSEPGGDAGRAIAAAARAGSSGGAKPVVDRAAETRASTGSGHTQRFAMNGTAIDDGPSEAARPPQEDAVRAALAQRAPLEVPPASGQHYDPGHQEIVFPRGHSFSTGSGGTGPLSGEARTRPPERGLLLPLAGAAVFAVVLVGGAVLVVTKPWVKRAVATATTTATAPPTAPPMTAPPTTAVAETSATAATASPTSPSVAPVAPATGPAPVALAATPATPAVVLPAARQGGGPAGVTAHPAPAASAPLASAHIAPTSPPPSATHKPARPGAASGPRPEDVGFE